MTKKRDETRTESNNDNDKNAGLSRRDFVRTGAAAGIGAAALLDAGTAKAQGPSTGAAAIQWDYDVDVVIAGAGCAGLTAAIRARDLGASVLVVDQNFDVGGRMLHSGSFVSLGGGDPLQLRDMAGEADKEGFITSPPVEAPEELDDSVELLFTDITDWSIVDRSGHTPYRFNEREMVRAWAENCSATRQFMIDNYVRFGRINGTHAGGGMSRARGAVCFLMLGDRTDIKAGTVTPEDAGVADRERTSPFAPVQMNNSARFIGEGAVSNGAALSRCLEFAAREKGVQFMLNRHFDELVREEPFAGRILGIKAHYSPRFDPDTGEQLQSYWNDGNVDETREVVNIRARKGVVLASGGHAGNP
ncbi:MAG: FAD-dependent oxidoreductase, partial [Gammaproteobacteria bacterium]|nr:FAD-dependent oxidoreductase [Gammaproteobacteria bacterium]